MPPKLKSKPTTPVLPPITRSGSARASLGTARANASHVPNDNQSGLSEEGRVIFEMLMDKLDSIVEELKVKTERLDTVEQENVNLKAKIMKIEDRIEFLETRDRCNNLILSGGALSTLNEGSNVQSVSDFLRQHLQYELNPNRVTSAFRLGPRPSSQSADTRRLMIRFRNIEDRDDLMSVCKRRKPHNLYANEDLTAYKANLLFSLRQVRKKSNGKITACGSMSGRVFAYLKPPNESGRNQRIFIDSMEKLDELCQRELGGTRTAICENGVLT